MSLPPSSPRLPSPPPAPEIQIGPKSPAMGPIANRQAQQYEMPTIDLLSHRRIHPGTKAADMAAGPPLVPLHQLDSAFQLQEHLAALHWHHTAGNTTPITRETAKVLATPPAHIDKTVWLYELCRFLITQCNNLIVGFLFDEPPCSAATCPEMRASEWQFLCAVHDAPKSCCAIDYCCHTLDWAANTVTNPKYFPSRFFVDTHDKNLALRHLVNIFRRLHRMFAHAWFQHRSVFWAVEGQTGLYIFFKTVCDHFKTLQHENFQLPPEAEGLESTTTSSPDDDVPQVVVEKPKTHQPGGSVTFAKPPMIASRGAPIGESVDEDGLNTSAMRTNTRRHIKSSPSVGSAVTTVPEAEEEDSSSTANLRGKSKVTHRRVPELEPATEEEMETDNIPVIVYHGTEEPPMSQQPVSDAETTVIEASAPFDTTSDLPSIESQQPETEKSETPKETEKETTSAQKTVTKDDHASEDQPTEESTPDKTKAETAEVDDNKVKDQDDGEVESSESAATAQNESASSAIPTSVSESEDSDVDTPASSSGSANDDPIGDDQESDKIPTKDSAADVESEDQPTEPEPIRESNDIGSVEKQNDDENETKLSPAESDSTPSGEDAAQDEEKKDSEKEVKDDAKEEKADEKAKASPVESVAKAN
ncbi:Mob1/phocein [Sordaria brevicollis]|uniref:Mob1/phocein n=1 Tax=Sordaria brevicollis TaxID=83679 RepID=A0AAE0UDJ4_SORBR|nr:Mob1/phocein [Sordaria brevicollis]